MGRFASPPAPSGVTVDDDDIDELADLWGVEPEEVEALYDALLPDRDWFDPGSPDFDSTRLTDYFDDIADELDLDAGEFWELWNAIYYGED